MIYGRNCTPSKSVPGGAPGPNGGGKPRSKRPFTTARREPWRTIVVGTRNSGDVIVCTTVPDDRSGANRTSATAFAEAGKRIGLVWLDAHGDLNTPMSTLSGNVHGMPVAHLLGHGDPAMARIARPAPAVRPENVVLVGIRDLDPPEREHARRFGIRVFTMREIDERGLRAVMDDALALAGQGTDGLHVSLDMDWIDPDEAPGVGTPVRGGATYREAHLAMEMLADAGRMVSMDVVEINPVLDLHNRTAELAVGLVGSAFGLRIL